MTKADVTGPNDIANIKLALQGYNFGADVYFNYLEKKASPPGLKKVQKLLPK